MRTRLLDWLACPRCGKDLRLSAEEADGEEIVSGWLACACAARFPVLDGIPCFLPPEPVTDRRSRSSFGFQWAVYRAGDRTWFKDDIGQRKSEFLAGMDVRPEELPGRSLLDAGCGNGELTRALAGWGLEVVAVDYSASVHGARRRLLERSPQLAGRLHYLRADLRHLPLRPGRFDLVHSSGVLHHTPSTADSLRRLSRMTAPGGKLYVQVYRRRPPWIHAVNVALRAVTTRLPLRLLYAGCYLATPAHAGLSRLVHRLRGEPPPPRATARERAVQMFDNYSPRYQHRHTVEEIRGLFRAAGYPEPREVTLENERRHLLAVLGARPRGAGAAEPDR